MEKHACYGRGNDIITKTFSNDDVNDTFLPNRLCHCFLCLIGVRDVGPILINMELSS